MKKTDLIKFVGKDLENWEIINVDYDNLRKKIEFNLREFQMVRGLHSLDRKDYTGKYKKLVLYDEYAFSYCDAGKHVNTIKKFVEYRNGIDFNNIERIFKQPNRIAITSIQSEWIDLLEQLNLLNKEEYKTAFLEKLKDELIAYYSFNQEQELFEEISFFFDNIIKVLKSHNEIEFD